MIHCLHGLVLWLQLVLSWRPFHRALFFIGCCETCPYNNWGITLVFLAERGLSCLTLDLPCSPVTAGALFFCMAEPMGGQSDRNVPVRILCKKCWAIFVGQVMHSVCTESALFGRQLGIAGTGAIRMWYQMWACRAHLCWHPVCNIMCHPTVQNVLLFI